VLHVVGELDTLTAPLLAVRLAEQQAAVPKLVVDLSEVSFLGSAGLAALVELTSSLTPKPGPRRARRASARPGSRPPPPPRCG
jgi:anti-anti-sigma factor